MPIDPFKDTPNLFELIGQDEQLKEAGQSIEDFLKGAILGNTTDLVGAPVQILGDALNALGVPVGTKPVGGTNWLREQLGQAQPADESLAQTLGSLVGMPDPQSATTALGLLGAIRKGGNPELFAWHNSDIGKIIDLLDESGALSNPSIGISKFNPFHFGGHESVSLLMRPGDEIDPAKVRADLFNRDGYTTRIKSDVAQYLDDTRFTENAAPKDPSHLLSIAASPKFKSLKEFEESPYGAGTLLTPKTQDYASDRYDEIKERLNASAMGEDFVPQTALERQAWAKEMVKGLDVDDPTGLGQELLNILKASPSEYAELKKLGDLPLNSDTVAGVLLPPSYYYDSGPYSHGLAKSLEDTLQVPVGTAQDLLTSDEKTKLMSMAEWLAGQIEYRKVGTQGIQRPYLSDEGRRMWGRINETAPTRAQLPYNLRYANKPVSQLQAMEEFFQQMVVSPWLDTMKARQLTKE